MSVPSGFVIKAAMYVPCPHCNERLEVTLPDLLLANKSSDGFECCHCLTALHIDFNLQIRDAAEHCVEPSKTGPSVTEDDPGDGQAKKICHRCTSKLTCTWQPDNAKECHFFSPASTLSV
jgi:hypothetical protein